jgi:hypothetical protein
MRLALLLSSFISCLGQTIDLSLSTTRAFPGESATLTITWTDAAPSVSMAGFQWTTIAPIGTIGVALAGAASDTARKGVWCNAASCQVVGGGRSVHPRQPSLPLSTLNVHSIASGQIANIPIVIPEQPIAGTYQISVANLIGVSAAGSLINIPAPSPVTLVVVRPRRPRLQWQIPQ